MVTFSENLDLKLQPNTCETCRACGLYFNQLPLTDCVEKAEVFWVGLSAVRLGVDSEKTPLGNDTKSGALIAEIEEPLRKNYFFYKTNLVKCLPLNSNDKIRYPSKKEMRRCFENLENELNTYNPSIVFLLGKQVSNFVLSKIGEKEISFSKVYEYEYFTYKGSIFIPVHHPSYMLIYKRKDIKRYIKSLRKKIKHFA